METIENIALVFCLSMCCFSVFGGLFIMSLVRRATGGIGNLLDFNLSDILSGNLSDFLERRD